MQTLRRAARVAIFDRAACREILYDPRAIYQGLAVLAAGFAASALWAFVDPDGQIGPSSPATGTEAWTRSAWSALWQAVVGGAVWIFGILAIMLFGRRVMASDATPSWRRFISLWCFAETPWAAVSLISIGLSLIGYGADLGRLVVSASLVVLLAGMVWGIAVAGARGQARVRLGVHYQGEYSGGSGLGVAKCRRIRRVVPVGL